MKRVILFFAALCLASFPPAAQAHETQPAYLDLRQTGPDTYSVLWKVPARADLRGGILLQLPPESKITSEVVRYETGGSQIERYELQCPGGLDGRTISVTGPAAALADVLVQLTRPDGSVAVFHLTPMSPAVVLTGAQPPWQRSLVFVQRGISHILTGVDHLLFVLGLLLIVRNGWMLVKTITAFTIAHSITLAIATLGYATAPLPPLYAAIALSILFLGPEIMRFRRGETSLTLRHPWVIAFAFGLLHGFGFASGLTELGLARAEIPWALLFFNIGVEIGQLFFVSLILLLERSFRVLQIRWTHWAELIPPYAIGSLGAFWTIQRTVILWQSLS